MNTIQEIYNTLSELARQCEQTTELYEYKTEGLEDNAALPPELRYWLNTRIVSIRNQLADLIT